MTNVVTNFGRVKFAGKKWISLFEFIPNNVSLVAYFKAHYVLMILIEILLANWCTSGMFADDTYIVLSTYSDVDGIMPKI